MTAFARLAQIAADPAPCLTARQIIEARLGRSLGPIDTIDTMPADTAPRAVSAGTATAKEAEMTEAKTQWCGPGEKPHEYKPDYMAMGDCSICGHTREAHSQAVPQMAEHDAAIRDDKERGLGMTVDLHLRVPEELAEWLKSEATENDRTLQGQIVFLLKKAAKKSTAERIVAAAIQIEGVTISLPQPARHGTILTSTSYSLNLSLGQEVQGFLTSSGRFVNRIQARHIANIAGQNPGRSGGRDNPELYSEDLR